MTKSEGAGTGARSHRPQPADQKPLAAREVFSTWLPLAVSWVVMSSELPLLSAIITRLPNAEVQLAAYGGVVLPVALIIEAPVLMLLAASVALARDVASYRLMFRFMTTIGVAMTAVHALLAFTPLFDIVLLPLLNPPPEVIEPARLGLRIMLPWTWAIGYRRFQQGVMIRFKRSKYVTIGTVVRLVAALSVALTAAFVFGAPGIVTATAAIATGVTVEAVYSRWAVQPVLRGPLLQADAVKPALTLPVFFAFFVPLVLTSLLSLIVQPIGSAAMARMPNALASLAAWPVANGLMFILRSMAFAFNEVVVALIDRPGAFRALWRFTLGLAGSLLLVTALIGFTPLAKLWFHDISGLNLELTALATVGFCWAVLWPSVDVFRNLVQGIAVSSRRTAAISWSMGVFIGVIVVLLTVAVVTQRFEGLPTAMVAFFLATVVQVVMLTLSVRGEARRLARL